MSTFKNCKTLKFYTKTVNVFSPMDIDSNAPFAIFITNFDEMLHILSPRTINDNKHLSVYEILSYLEDNARIAFRKYSFNTVEIIHAGGERYAYFYFKELRQCENGTYVAYYEFDCVRGEQDID